MGEPPPLRPAELNIRPGSSISSLWLLTPYYRMAGEKMELGVTTKTECTMTGFVATTMKAVMGDLT